MIEQLRRILVILGFLTLTFAGSNILAQAAVGPPSTPQAGTNTLIEPPPAESSGPQLLFDSYSIGDYAGITGAAGSGGLGTVNIPNDVGDALADMAAVVLFMVGFVSSRLVEWAFSLDIIAQLGPAITGFVGSLRSTFYAEWMPVIIVLAAIMAAYTFLISRRFLHGILGILWAGLALSIAAAMLAAPVGFLSVIDNVATGVTSSLVTGAASDIPGTPIGTFQSPGASTGYEVRLLANELWTDAVYDPWTAIEFGSVDPQAPNGDHLGIELLKKNDGQPNNYAQDISQAPAWMQSWANGDQGVSRFFFGAAVSVGGLILLLIALGIALAVIVGQLTVIVLGCVSIAVWLLAPIPSFGPRLVMRWFVGILAGFAISTIGAFYLVLLLSLLGGMASISQTVGIVAVGFLDLAILMIAFWMRRSLFHIGRHMTGAAPLALVGHESKPSPELGGTHAVVKHAHKHAFTAQKQLVKPLAKPAVAGGKEGKPAVAAAADEAKEAGKAAGKQAPTAAARKAAAKGTAATAKQAAGGAAKTGAATGGKAAAAGSMGVMTAGASVAALAALKAGQAGLRGYESARRRTVSTVLGGMGHQVDHAPHSMRHSGPSLWSSSQKYLERVHVGGTRPLKGQRVRPLDNAPKVKRPPVPPPSSPPKSPQRVAKAQPTTKK